MFAVLQLPGFALQAVLRTESGLASRPVALMSAEDARAVVRLVNAPAAAQGVEPGLTAPQAMARCAAVVLRFRSPAAEREAGAALLAGAWRLSPRVEATAEGVCTVDLRGREPRHAGVEGGEIIARLRALGLEPRLGFGRTPRLARYAAGAGNELAAAAVRSVAPDPAAERAFLAPLPLAFAEPTPEQAGILEGWGIRTLGALTALPRREAALRLGAGGEALWARAAGEEERVLRLEEPPREFAAAHDFEPEVETLEPLLFLLRRFTDQLVAQLEGAGLAAAELRLSLVLAGGPAYEREFRLPEPTLAAEALFRVLHTHLASVRTESPVTGLRLEARPARPLHKQDGLFDGSLRDPHGFNETLARVGAIVGAGRVGRPACEPTHRPDAVRVEAVDARFGDAPDPAGPAIPGLPLRRFRPPVPVRVQGDGDRPAWLASAVAAGPIRAWRGPFLLSGDWWKPERWEREEWDVELEAGGLFRLARTAAGWTVEGCYD